MASNEVAPAVGQGELWEELAVRHHWFHILRATIIDNQIAKMGTTAWAVYCVIKAYTDLKTGTSFPSQQTIAGHLGVSVDTVQRALKVLLEMKLVEQHIRGRKSLYGLVEQVPVDKVSRDRFGTTVSSEPYGTAQIPYVPIQFAEQINKLIESAKSGELPAHIHINIIQQGDNSTAYVANSMEIHGSTVKTSRMGAADSAVVDASEKIAKRRQVLNDIE